MSSAETALGQLRRDLRSARIGSGLVQAVVMGIAGVITAYGTGNAHTALHHHSTPDPWGWMLYPAVELALIVELQVAAYLARYDVQAPARNADGHGFNWGLAMRLVTGMVAILLNMWSPMEDHDGGGAVLHFLGPFVQIFIIEALGQFRMRYAKVIAYLSAEIAEAERKTAGRVRTPAPGVPGAVPGPVPGGVPAPGSGAYPNTAPPVPRTAPRTALASAVAVYPAAATAAVRPGPVIDVDDPAALRARALEIDAQFREQFGRPASIRALRQGLRVGQDKAGELQKWLAGNRVAAAAAGASSTNNSNNNGNNNGSSDPAARQQTSV